MEVVSTGQQPMSRYQVSLPKKCNHTIYLSVEDENYHEQEVPIVITHHGIHHYSPTTIISNRELKKYHVSKFLEHCQAALQVTAPLEEFSDPSDSGGSA